MESINKSKEFDKDERGVSSTENWLNRNWAWAVAILIVIVDQIVKFYIKLDMTIGEEIIVIPNWFRIHFIENEGMAFGWSFGEFWGKLFLTLFRLAIVPLFGIYLYRLIKRKASKWIIVAMALIIAGALGNIIDCVFYGKIFSASTATEVAILFPNDGGYAGLLFGKVVDMFYFPLFECIIPSWVPIFGGTYFSFFDYIFNVADASISVGFVLLILFYRKLEAHKE